MLVRVVTNPSEIQIDNERADLIELRLDYFEITEKPAFPCIFTLRKKEQGGVSTPTEENRLEKIEKYLQLEPEYLDIEADTDPEFIERIAQKFPNTKLIGSYHNFENTPEDLNATLEGMKNPHFAIYKIAVTAKSTTEMLQTMLFAKHARLPLAIISMGPFGKPSRVLGPIVGNVLDYASLEEDENLHRYSLETLLEVFHYRKLNKDTEIYALIGDPIEKSPGHLFHNPRFHRNAVYVKMCVQKNEVRKFFELLRNFQFGGLSVTVPLKELVYPVMDELTPIAKAVGAVNTVTFLDGKAIGTNTDAAGALNAIEREGKVKGKKVAILGAGGTARAIAYEAVQRGAVVSIFNRTPERSKRLAKEFGAAGYSLEELGTHPYDILVNTIPPKSIHIPEILEEKVVMDVVYDPKITPLLEKAKERGCQIITGEEMFLEQAVLQQKEWGVAQVTNT